MQAVHSTNKSQQIELVITYPMGLSQLKKLAGYHRKRGKAATLELEEAHFAPRYVDSTTIQAP